MLALILILLFALLPALLSLWQLHQFKQRTRRRIAASWSRSLTPVSHPNAHLPEFRYVEGIGYLIGDLSCEFNARSPHVRCAVNPLGPCQGCHAYKAREFSAPQQRQ